MPFRIGLALVLSGVLAALSAPVITVLIALAGMHDVARNKHELGARESYAIVFALSTALCGVVLIGSSRRAARLYGLGAFVMCLVAYFSASALRTGQGSELLWASVPPVVAGFGAACVASRWSSISEMTRDAFDDYEGRPALAKWSVAVVMAGIAALLFWPAPQDVRALMSLVASIVGLGLAAASLPNRMAGGAALLSMIVIFHLYYSVLF